MIKFICRTLMLIPLCTLACAHRLPYPSVDDDGLKLEKVVLYRNGVGYFERKGSVENDILRLRVRKDHVNDLLKSLTVVDEKGQALSVSMPLDPSSWVNLSQSLLQSKRNRMAQMLDQLRGTEVMIRATSGRYSGRIVLVERIQNEPDPLAKPNPSSSSPYPLRKELDHRVVLMAGAQMEMVRLSKILSIQLRDGDLAMQFHRNLDASSGDGMFQQVDVEIRLSGQNEHEVLVSYVVEAPIWKPTYRVVLPESGKGESLLQAWAVVDNLSGEDWRDVSLSLTSGAPIAFRYDLHTPRSVERMDLSESGVHRVARAQIGEAHGAAEDMAEAEELQVEEPEADSSMELEHSPLAKSKARFGDAERKDSRSSVGSRKPKRMKSEAAGGMASPPAAPSFSSGIKFDSSSLRKSMVAQHKSRKVAGLTQIDLKQQVTLLDGNSTMVALLNETVQAEQSLLFRPGGSGSGFEANPYRVVRFTNKTPYVLEPGPISIYSGGSFVGEGISEAVSSGVSVTIPFAVDPTVELRSQTSAFNEKMHIVKIMEGVLEVEQFYRAQTQWELFGPRRKTGYRVWIRQSRYGNNYELVEPHEEVEKLVDGYLIPFDVPAGKVRAQLKVVEETPSKISISIWDQRSEQLLDQLLKANNLDRKTRARLQPIVDARRKIAKIDREVLGLKEQQREYDQRAKETRDSLYAIKKDALANDLRKRLNRRLDEFTRQADKLGRKVIELQSQRMELKIALDDQLENFRWQQPKKSQKEKKVTKSGKPQTPEASENKSGTHVDSDGESNVVPKEPSKTTEVPKERESTKKSKKNG